MTERSLRLVCVVAYLTALGGALVGLLRWLGPAGVARSLEGLGRAPLLVGGLGPVLVYLVVQSLPGGRTPVSLFGRSDDGWTTVLSGALLCAALAAWPARRGAPFYEILYSAPVLLIAAFCMMDRIRRVQRARATPA